jgi:YtoQ family protein
VIVRFGDKYRQWNAAFDAGTAYGLGIPVITLHAPELTHALKEIDAMRLFQCLSSDQNKPTYS